MRKIGLAISALVLVSSAVFSQGQLDLYKIGQTDLNGTARYMSMGGAFGALGGDISAMHTNPAGLAVYRSSEVVTTMSLSTVSAKTDWLGTKSTENRTKFNFDNIAYVGYFPTSNDRGIMGWNIGFSYNRIKNFSRNYTARESGREDYSLSDYMAVRANGWYDYELAGDDGKDPFSGNADWLSIMAYNSYIINPINAENNLYESDFTGEINDRDLLISERGAIDQYNIAFGMNISDIVLLGANVAITDVNYRYTSSYQENFESNSFLRLDNWLETEGTGYAFNIGAIVQPIQYLRFGVSYNTPTWYKLTDYYYAEASTEINEDFFSSPTDNARTEYEYRTPDKWLFSAAAILGTTALISVDYELTNYKNMKMYNWDGIEDENARYTNLDIRDNFKTTGTLRVGAEVKVTPQFAVRAGAAWIGNPMKDDLKDVNKEVYTVGTIPHFTTQKSLTNYTLGLGYRFTPNFYMDLACILRHQKEDLYAYSRMFDESGDLIKTTPSSLKTNTTRVALTLGYKF